MKTKIFVTLLSLGLVCGSAYAAAGNEAPLPTSNDVNMTAPDQSGSWSLGVTGVLMKPTNSSTNYATQYDYTVDSNGNHTNATSTPETVTAGYYKWFGADITYAFPGHGRDVTLAYEGLHGSSADSTTNNFDNEIPAPATYHYLIGNITGADLSYIKAEIDTQYDAGDLVFGQKFNVGQRVQLHPFMGLRYARIDIEQKFNETLEAFPNDGDFGGNVDGKADSTFSGIGPRFGSDAGITLGRGFSLRGRLGLSALVGSQQYTVAYNQNAIYRNAFNLPPTSHESTKTLDDGSVTRIIPEIDGRLGLNYTYHFASTTALGFEAGWQATDYLQAVSNTSTTNTSRDDFGVEPPHYEYSNFGLQGPYARIQLDVA